MEDATQVASSEVPVVKGDAVDLKTVDVSVKVMIIECSVSQNYICLLMAIMKFSFCKSMQALHKILLNSAY